MLPVLAPSFLMALLATSTAQLGTVQWPAAWRTSQQALWTPSRSESLYGFHATMHLHIQLHTQEEDMHATQQMCTLRLYSIHACELRVAM